MKRIHEILIYSSLAINILGCGGGDDGFVEPEKKPIEISNSVPSTPALTYPSNELVCIDNELKFKWAASSDADGDVVSYLIQIANDESFTDVVNETTTENITMTILLEKGRTFHWRVLANDNETNSEYSKPWKFYTEAEAVTNQLPSQPELIAPIMDETIVGTTTNLSWNVTDDDNDVLTYDLYFGLEDDPLLYKEGLDNSFLEVSVVVNKTYYWKIISRDGKGGVSIGSIWSFTTQ